MTPFHRVAPSSVRCIFDYRPYSAQEKARQTIIMTTSSGSNAAAASNSNSDNDSSGRGGGDGFTEQDLVKGLTVSWSLLRLVVGGMTRVVLPAPSSYQVPGTWYLNNQYQVPMLRYVLTHNSYRTRIIRTYSRHLVHHCFFLFRKAVREPVVHGHRTPVHPCGGH